MVPSHPASPEQLARRDIDAQLTAAAQLRQAIPKRAFEGRLVPALTPADSSTLLAAQVAE